MENQSDQLVSKFFHITIRPGYPSCYTNSALGVLFWKIVHAIFKTPEGWKNDESSTSPSDFEAKNNNVIEMIQMMVECDGGQVDSMLPTRDTLLHIAVGAGLPKVVEFLLKNGANPNAINKSGESPLHVAVRCGRPREAELLKNYGAKFHVKDTLENDKKRLRERRSSLQKLKESLDADFVTLENDQK